MIISSIISDPWIIRKLFDHYKKKYVMTMTNNGKELLVVADLRKEKELSFDFIISCRGL